MSNNWDPYCVLCKHFEVEKFNQKHLRHCKAFQGKIPDDIIEGRVDHRLPYEGDNGIQFELQEDTSKLYWQIRGVPIEHVKRILEISIYYATFSQKQREQEAKKDVDQTDNASDEGE